MKKLLIFTLVLGLTSLLSSPAQALDVTAESGYCEHIQAAVDQVADAGGGNVSIPEGVFNFINDGETWCTVYVPPGVNIFGAGMIDENIVFDETNQTDNWRTVLKLPYEYPTGVGDDADEYEFFELRNPDESSKSNRLSGFAIVGYRDELLAQGRDPISGFFPTFKAIKIFGVVDFRIDHVLIRNAGGGAVEIKNDYTGTTLIDYYGQGVIDHCKFINTAGWGCAEDHPRDYSTRTVGYGVGFRLSWSADFSDWEYDISEVLGKYNRTVFIEDCYLQRWRHCYCGNSGAHIVFRYNTINLDCAYGSIDSHEDYRTIGTRAVEVYNNSIVNPNPYDERAAINLRGGAGIFFNNTVTDYRFFIEMPVRWTNYECRPHDIWMWDNTIDVWGTVYNIHSSYIENVDYFLRAPSLAQDGFTYTPYPYPHSLTLEGLEYPVNITGTVTDFNTSLPLQVATVTCNARSGTTNSTGVYFIMMPSTGSCTLTASKTGYTTNSTFLDFPTNGTYTQDFVLTPLPDFNVSGRLTDKNNNPLQANINIYEQETTVSSVQTSNGYYSLSIPSGVYDLQYNILNFFIPNFFVKLLSLDISSSLTDIVNYVTNIGNQNVSFIADITDTQLIQTYSSQKPERILINGTVIPSVSSYSQLTDNTWFYDSTEDRLYILANVSLPVLTCIDGTAYGECSSTQPLYCDDGDLINKCSVCDCPIGQACNMTSETCYTPPGENKTFGKTDIGGSTISIYQHNIAGCNFTLPEDGTVTKISVYLTNAGGGSYDYTVLIYNSTWNFIARSDQTLTLPLDDWYNFTFSQDLESGDYWLIAWTSAGSGTTTLYYDTGSTDQWGVRYQDYNSPPDPLGSWQITNNYNMSIYAIYTPS